MAKTLPTPFELTKSPPGSLSCPRVRKYANTSCSFSVKQSKLDHASSSKAGTSPRWSPPMLMHGFYSPPPQKFGWHDEANSFEKHTRIPQMWNLTCWNAMQIGRASCRGGAE